jgi:hypothetical protein
MRFSHIFFHGLALRLGMTTPATVFRRSAATARLLNEAAEATARALSHLLTSRGETGENKRDGGQRRAGRLNPHQS